MPLPHAIAEFMQKHKVGSDEIWAVPGGRAYAVKHSALERIAFQNNIVFGLPQIVEADGANGIATMIVTGKLGDFEQWSIGEASPKNNKNAYAFAMAEKRAKDRVILKLLNIHGILYSEEEADDFKRQDKAAANDQTISADLYDDLIDLIEEAGADLKRFTQFMGVANLRDLPKAKYPDAVAALNAKKVRHVA